MINRCRILVTKIIKPLPTSPDSPLVKAFNSQSPMSGIYIQASMKYLYSTPTTISRLPKADAVWSNLPLFTLNRHIKNEFLRGDNSGSINWNQGDFGLNSSFRNQLTTPDKPITSKNPVKLPGLTSRVILQRGLMNRLSKSVSISMMRPWRYSTTFIIP